jgi:hypothetical protein
MAMGVPCNWDQHSNLGAYSTLLELFLAKLQDFHQICEGPA